MGVGAMTRLGIVAGGGRLPLLIAEAAGGQGRGVHIVGIRGEADAGIQRFPHSWVGWGEIGRMLGCLRAAGCGEIVIAGAVRRPDLFALRPDGGLLRHLPLIVRLLAGGDDSVLQQVVRFFERAGFAVRGAHEVAPGLLAPQGQIGALALGEAEMRDARLGFAVRRALQGVDTGQAVAVAGGRVLAIEGAEGTDAVLQRLARSAGAAAGVLAKGPKPGQELRIDMPAIGPRTIRSAAAASLAAVVVEAGAVLLLDRAELIAAADAAGCAVYGLEASATAAAAPEAACRRARVIGVRRPGRRARGDLERGVAVVEALGSVGVEGAAVVDRSLVLAIEPGDALGMLERVSGLRQWGLGARRRRGVLVLRAAEAYAEAAVVEVLSRASAQRLAGVAVIGPPRLTEPFAQAVRLADELEMFLAVGGQPAGAQ
jgi:DUF1009 family protein